MGSVDAVMPDRRKLAAGRWLLVGRWWSWAWIALVVACGDQASPTLGVMVSPNQVTLAPGASVEVSVEVSGGPAVLALLDAPAGVEDRFEPNPANGPATLFLSAAGDVPPGTHVLRVSASSGARSAVAEFGLEVTAGSAGGPITATVGPEGALVLGPEGMALGVPVGHLAGVLDVTLERVVAPALPLPEDVRAEGGAYGVRSSVDVVAIATERGFILGLPVPEDVDGSTAGIAVLLPGERALHGQADVWLVLSGQFDEARGLLLVAVPVLSVAGDVYRLVTGDHLSAPPVQPPPVGNGGVAPLDVCSGYFDDFEVEAAPIIAAGTLVAVAADLDAALGLYRSLGFEPFLLRTTGWQLYVTDNGGGFYIGSCSDIRYLVNIPAYGPSNAYGSYDPGQQAFLLYPAGARSETERRKTIFHELFHSIQARYLGTPAMQDRELRYFLEGTAALSEALARIPPELDVSRSSEYDTRVVDETLLASAGELPYEAQDFWYFVGRTHGRPFHRLMLDLFTVRNASPASVDSVLRLSPYNSSLAEQYRKWVLDHIYDLTTCRFDGDAVKGLVDLGVVSVDDSGALGVPDARNESRDRLNARVLKVVVDNSISSEPFQLAVRVQDDWANLERHRVALVQQRGAGSCSVLRTEAFERVGDDAVHRLSVGPSAPDTLYLVLHNGDHQASQQGRVLLDPAPSLTGSVTASTTAVTAESLTTVTFQVPFRDEGANIESLIVAYELGGSGQTLELDVKTDADVAGFDGTSGTGEFRPSIFVYCGEQGKNPMSFTFSLRDDLDFVSREERVELTVDYGGCP